MAFFERKETVLFQGDSITDCKRDREDIASLGTGYPLLVASYLSAHAHGEFSFINKGISGDRACDLETRWDKDCLSLKPTTVSIMIGINDTWRRFDKNTPTSADAYEAHYRNILTRTKNELNAKIIMLEPFLLPVREDYMQWRDDLDPKIQAARALAREFGALYIPLDGIFASACAKRPPEYWAPDGVHPSIAGHGLIATAWIKAVSGLHTG